MPLMLATAVSFIALRHRSLYQAQRDTRRESPAHRDELIFDALRDVRVGDIIVKDRPYAHFREDTPAAEVVRCIATADWQDAFPVLSIDGKVVGVITAGVLRTVAQEPSVARFAIAHDMMHPPAIVQDSADVSSALEILFVHSAREVVVVDDHGRIVGFLDEHEITRLYRDTTRGPTAGRGPAVASTAREGSDAGRVDS